jgi:osmotically-inducible protein OsmY
MKGSLFIAIFAAALAVGQAPDNTKTNQRDRNDHAVTADQQNMTKADLDLLQKIRQSVTADKTLSTYAHNVKIVVQEGNVTLRGPVRTQAEREAVEQKAVAIAGASHVTNQLDLVPEKSN